MPCAVLAAHVWASTASTACSRSARCGDVSPPPGATARCACGIRGDAAGNGANPQPARSSPSPGWRREWEGRHQQAHNRLRRARLINDAALLSCGWDQTVRVWVNRAPGTPAGAGATDAESIQVSMQAVLALTLLADGRLATGAGDGAITLWAASTASGGALAESGSCRVERAPVPPSHAARRIWPGGQ